MNVTFVIPSKTTVDTIQAALEMLKVTNEDYLASYPKDSEEFDDSNRREEYLKQNVDCEMLLEQIEKLALC
jgi:hypothetical protein